MKNKLQHFIDIYQQLRSSLSENENFDEVDILVKMVELFRPKKRFRDTVVDLEPLIRYLSEHQDVRDVLIEYLRKLLFKRDFSYIFTDAGILNYADFFHEVKKRITQKVLPFQPIQNTLEFILNQVFYNTEDPVWLNNIPREQLLALFDLLDFKTIYTEQKISYEFNRVLYSLEVLGQRISGRALEADVSKMVPEYENFDSPFIGLLRELTELIINIKKEEKKYVTSDDITYKQVLILHKQCMAYIDTAFDNARKYGISLKVNQSLLRIKYQLIRISEILPFLVLNPGEDPREKTIDFTWRLIEYNCNKSKVRRLINESTQLLSYEVTRHTAETGEKYITKTKKEYIKMLWSACWGGVIVAFLCIIKLLLTDIDTSDFGHAVLYSMNYSLGFMAIYLLGGTLATKQPAMTASALVSALEKNSNNKAGLESKYWKFAVFFARVFRSQFIAFVGNVLMAFPVALLLIWGIDQLFGSNIAHVKWRSLIHDLDPLYSPAIIHAAIAGCFLFLSGVIAGTIVNRDKHNSVYYRIEQHPLLKKILGKEKAKKISKVYEKKWAGIISNFWFGIFMGSVSSIGIFIGLDLDIRHITFASGNLALGLYGSGFQTPFPLIFWSVLGIIIIGAVNFLVSFSLSLMMAFRSRNLSILELRLVALSIWELFKMKPLMFFFPPRKDH